MSAFLGVHCVLTALKKESRMEMKQKKAGGKWEDMKWE